jgi:hypothetical protein
MCRGPSDFQARVLYRLKKRAWVDVIDLIELSLDSPGVAESYRSHYERTCDCATRRECRSRRKIRTFPNLSALYRSMDSLERRGQVMAVMGVEPRRWVWVRHQGQNHWVPWDHIMRTWRRPISVSDEDKYSVELRCRGLSTPPSKNVFPAAETPLRYTRPALERAR